MMKLQTKVAIPEANFNISYSDTIFQFGSCFADNIGNLLKHHKFNTHVNPFGVLYNPASIAQAINLLQNKAKFTESDLDFYNEKWFSFKHHSSFSDTNKQNCLNTINAHFSVAKTHIKHANTLMITFGTAWVYHKLNDELVANCHKIPAKEFKRKWLSPAEIEEMICDTILQLRKHKPSLNIIVTVSPIRHWKDGAIENMRSKSSLILAIKAIQKKLPNIYYFPSYEIFMDELRDYRFYASDMLHPSDLAIEYNWQIFKNTFFSTETQLLYKQVEKLLKSFAHRTFDTSTKQYQSFKNKLLLKTAQLEKEHPYLCFEKEKNNLH